MRFAGGRPPKALEFFFNAGGLLLPGNLFGELGVAFGQLLEALIGLDAGDDWLQFFRADPLTVIFAVFPPLQQEVRPLGNGLAAALDLVGLLAEMAADHVIDLGYFLKDPGAFLLDTLYGHS